MHRVSFRPASALAAFFLVAACAAPSALRGEPLEFDLTTLHPEDDRTALDPIDESRFDGPPPEGQPLREPDWEWVEETLAAMTLEEKIGQLFVSNFHGNGEELIDQFHTGGFVFLGNNQRAEDIVATVNRLQEYADVPLWFSIDAEAGVGARVSDATIYPLIMAFGAANDPELTELCGRITARESAALGLQVAYGPVVDVNTEPKNPIIATRAYSDRPGSVVELAHSFINGARAEGVLTTLKHYPGHGATAGDSHHMLPAVHKTMEEIERIHLRPYRELQAMGDLDLIMTGHVWYPAVDPDEPWPATLSSTFNTDILREEIGFEGLLVSDAFNMRGLTSAVPDPAERSVLGIEAGLDVIVVPARMDESFEGVRQAVLSGRLSVERIEQSARRVLAAKTQSGLHESRLVDPDRHLAVLNHPDHRAAVRRLAEEAFTEAKNGLPNNPVIGREEKVLLLSLDAQRRIFYRFGSSFFHEPFVEQVPNTEILQVPTEINTGMRQSILQQAHGVDKVVVIGYDWYEIQSEDQVELINELTEGTAPVVYTSFGAPYHYLQIPGVDVFFCGYASVPEMQQVAVEVLLGDREALGKLPVTVEGLNEPPSAFVVN